jgi:imidazole glycerol-phosphate synthase subunit HisF
MRLPRVMPCLLLRGEGLYKTVRFDKARYVGDPRNAVRIYNEKEVDELILLDIAATRDGSAPQFDLVREIVSEAFMPVGYGGGIRSVDDARRMLSLGVEKIVICTSAIQNPALVREAADAFGSQSVVVCLDVRKSLLGRYEVCTHGGARRTGRSPVEFARAMQAAGAGELMVHAIDRDGTQDGYDLELIRSVADAVPVPVVACGGARDVGDLVAAVRRGGASALAAGSLFVFHGRHRAVLINFPSRAELERAFGA